MKKLLFFLGLAWPLLVAAQSWPIGDPIGLPLSDPLYRYDASGNRIERYRTQASGPGFLRQADPTWELALSPNPSDGVFLLRSSLELVGAELHVYDLSGRSVLRQPMQGTALKLDLSQQPTGVYIFRVQSAHGVRELKGTLAR